MSGERRSSSPPTRSGWGSTRPTCARSCHERCRARSRPTTRRPVAPGATAAPARCVLLAENRDKGLHVYFINQVERRAEAKNHRWRQYRDGLGIRRGRAVPPAGDPAALRGSRSSPRRTGDAATSATGRRRRGGGRSRLEPVRRRTPTARRRFGGARRSSRVVREAVAEVRPDEGRRDPARRAEQGGAQVDGLRRAAGSRAYGDFGDARRSLLARSTRCSTAACCARPAAGTPKLALAEAAMSGRTTFASGCSPRATGTNLQAILDARPRRAAGSRSSRWARTSPTRAALERARGAPAIDDRGLRARRLPGPRGARRGDGRLARPSAASSWSCWPATCSCCRPAFLERFPGRVINVHPALLPAFPGSRAIEQALAYGVQGVRRDGPLRRRGRRHRAGDPPARRSSCRTRRDADAVLEAALHPIEHELLPEAVRLIARGARQRSTRPTRAGCVIGDRVEPMSLDAAMTRERAARRRARCGSRARAALGLRQDRDRRVRPRAGRARRRDRLDRRHRAASSTRRASTVAIDRRVHRLSRDHGRARQDAAPASSTPGCSRVRDDADHMAAAEEQGVESIDLVCVNLYPFERTVGAAAASTEPR